MNAPDRTERMPQQLDLPVEGMTCAACATRIERVLGRLPGVDASVNLAAERARVRLTDASVDAAQVIESIRKAGFSVPDTQAELAIEGMTCAACASRLEKVLGRLDGVSEAHVNFATETAQLRFRPWQLSMAQVFAAVDKAGFTAHPHGEDSRAREKARKVALWTAERNRFFIALVLTLPLVAQMPFMFFGDGGHDLIPRTWQWLLATPVQFWIGARFYRGAWSALRGGGANMDVLVALGTSMAYGFSTVVTALGWHQQHVYFEASAAIITLVLMGKLLEARAKARTADAIEALARLQPRTAWIEEDGQVHEVAVESVHPGQIFVVRAGDQIPVDGVVVSGLSAAAATYLTVFLVRNVLNARSS